MRNTEKALLDRIRGVAEICRSEGVACLANGDVENYQDALRVMKEYKVDGAMIARSAELNPSCFRREGKLPSIDVAREFLEKAIEVDNHLSNSKYCLNRILADRSKEPVYQEVCRAKSVKDLCDALEMDYTERLADVPSRGEKSQVARAAEGNLLTAQF